MFRIINNYLGLRKDLYRQKNETESLGFSLPFYKIFHNYLSRFSFSFWFINIQSGHLQLKPYWWVIELWALRYMLFRELFPVYRFYSYLKHRFHKHPEFS